MKKINLYDIIHRNFAFVFFEKKGLPVEQHQPHYLNRQPQGLYDPAYEHDACGVGFVANIDGNASYDIVRRGLEVLQNMAHRGATGADSLTGDGAGITIQMPHAFFSGLYSDLPKLGSYATGLVFLPQGDAQAEECVRSFEAIIEQEAQTLLWWREVPIFSACLGELARQSEPTIRQIFIKKHDGIDQDSFERILFVIRKQIERKIRGLGEGYELFHIPSLSTNKMVYKGLFLPQQLEDFFFDLKNPDLQSAIAMVHSRFSTNTFPTWDLAQPFRFLAHNGEINTIKGNIFWTQARESLLSSGLLGDDISKILPIIEPGKSDSMTFDNVLELLVLAGRSLPHAIMMMIPEAWNDKNPISDSLKAFYEYHATFMEPWDGPATIAFTDGKIIGATLDRNGLRPARYLVTKDNMIVMASESGVQMFEPEDIVSKGRLMPGKMLIVDTVEGRIIPDSEVKSLVANQHPYRHWLDENRVDLASLPVSAAPEVILPDSQLNALHHVFGYDIEEVKAVLLPMCKDGKEPVGSMGNDTPLAILSHKPQRLFNYFKQLFAQVTNPAIDPIREVLVMSLTSFIGCRSNLLTEGPEHCRSIKFKTPILTNMEVQKIREYSGLGFKSATIDILFPEAEGEAGLGPALDRLCQQVTDKINEGYQIIFLSDKNANKANAPIPSILATSAVHHYLVSNKTRPRIGLIIETGEAREVMHFGLLFGYGADAINPYLSFATIQFMIQETMVALPYQTAEHNYVHAIEHGILKIMSKMGISTLRSYRGSQLYEAIGLHPSVVDQYFTGTASRVGGIGLNEIAKEALGFHHEAYQKEALPVSQLRPLGQYRFRKDGEFHAWNPETVRFLQKAVRTKDATVFAQFSEVANRQTREFGMLRGLLEVKAGTPIPIEEVESIDDIVKRFATGAMSFGALSKEAHETLAVGMNKIGGRSNSGEGGEEPERFITRPDGTSSRSAIKQVASGRFGVTTYYLTNADELQIKISQGAKPGEGGQLPGHKVDALIAKTRYATPGVSLISPPPHHDIYSIEDLAQLIFDLKNVNPAAAVSVKLVAEVGVGTVAAGVAKAYADLITISGYDGGTGASPISSIRHSGIPWELGLSETQQTLVLNNLRGRVRLQVDGQLKTGRDVIVAALLGAEEFGFSTAALIAIGCVMVRECHLNTCPTGVATQDPDLRKKFQGLPDHVIQFMLFVGQEVREQMAQMGVRKLADIIGRTDLLEPRVDEARWKTAHLDFSRILYKPAVAYPCVKVEDQLHKIKDILDRELIAASHRTFEYREPVRIKMPIRNTNRTVGAMLSGQLTKRFGLDTLPEDTVSCHFVGTAGQSFGAWLVKGMTFRLEGDSNDYLGKGLSGGKIIVHPNVESTFEAQNNIIVGNTTLYGATDGEVYIRGMAGERFAIRNSGAVAVVEGAGDHCCEYMTGGRVIVLGPVGRNFAAGMSGGIAYVYDKEDTFDYFCNKEMVELCPLNQEDEAFLQRTIGHHAAYTNSAVGKECLDNWESEKSKFIKVLPLEYKVYLLSQKDIEVVEAAEG